MTSFVIYYMVRCIDIDSGSTIKNYTVYEYTNENKKSIVTNYNADVSIINYFVGYQAAHDDFEKGMERSNLVHDVFYAEVIKVDGQHITVDGKIGTTANPIMDVAKIQLLSDEK